MAEKTALLFGVHAHQPSGNFPEVLQDAHERCYAPFLRAVSEFPGFRFSIHLSGPLLDFLCERHPGDMALLAAMARRGQAELFGAGDTEPVLAVIPSRDRIGQIDALSAKLEARFGQRPSGAWLTERVWEATVVPALADCGIRYCAVDDYHFLCAGRTAAELGGYFTTEEDGRSLDLFPVSENLRYRIPFALAADAVAAIEGAGAAAVYFDDLEKFGIWPETHEWVHEKGWLRDFLGRVLASPRIETLTFREFHRRNRTRGVVYLPTTSYIEMNEWTLPAEAAREYAELAAQEKQAGRFAARKAFVRGGIWKNFLSRYPESNWMHKRMLSLSERLATLPGNSRTPAMRALLYAAQANDAYWHGLFGGLYMPHLRRGVWRSLVALEAMLDSVSPRPACERVDLDHDGIEELFLRSGALQAAIKLDGRASVCELDAYVLAQNFGDTLRRHKEHYHRRILDRESAEHRGSGIASAHDRVDFKHAITADDLAPDPRPRNLFVDCRTDAEGQTRQVVSYALQGGAGSEAKFAAPLEEVEKRLIVTEEALEAAYRLEGGAGVFRTELDLAMPSCDGFGGRYIDGGHIPGGFGQPLAIEGLTELTLDDRFMGGSLTLRCSPPARLAAGPYFTVSQSEGGFEKVMQSVSIVLEWSLAGGAAEIRVSLRIAKDRPAA